MANDIGFDFEIDRIDRSRPDGAVRVDGSTAGYRFNALLHRDHADLPEWELGRSRIAKLWIRRIDTKTVTFNFDRGMDIDARDQTTAEIVSFLAEGLANLVFGDRSDKR